MKLKEINISKEEVKKIFDEELLLFLHEEHEAGRLDENFLKHLKNAGKGMFDYYKMMMTNYAKMLDDMVNKDLIPSAMGQKIEDKLDDLDKPEEFKGEDPATQADAVSDLGDIMQATADAADAAGSEEAADKMDDMADAADAVERAAEKEASGASDSDPGETADEPKVKAAVLDLIDATSEKWDNIMAATKDGNLKKAMDYMEKVALAEKLLKAIHSQILENQKQKNKRN